MATNKEKNKYVIPFSGTLLDYHPAYDVYNDGIIVMKEYISGFFSQTTIILDSIIDYINYFKKLPNKLNTSNSFFLYKTENEFLNNIDITENYFTPLQILGEDTTENKIKINNETINYSVWDQFDDYRLIDYTNICPVVNKYFYPSTQVVDIINNIFTKYNVDYENTCVLFYRGNDKKQETLICDYNEYVIFSDKIYQKNPNIKFLIQSDETEFIQFMTNRYPNNSFYFKDEIRHMSKQNNSVDKVFKSEISLFSKNYLAITIIMSRCKYIICGSGNCSIWIMLYRCNSNNICQNLNGQWFCSVNTLLNDLDGFSVA
jgi:hypothetical protein